MGPPACKKLEWWGTGMVICLERDADLHMAQLMPLPLTVSCFSKIQIGFTFLVPAHLCSPGQRAVKQVCVCVCRWAATRCSCPGCTCCGRDPTVSEHTRSLPRTRSAPAAMTSRSVDVRQRRTKPRASAHSGKWGQLTPWEMDEKLKSENMQKEQFSESGVG